MTDYQWVVTNPLGIEVTLKQSTFDAHIMDAVARTDVQLRNLALVSDAVREIIQEPRFIYYDENPQRQRYIDLISFKELNHLQGLVVVVDTDRIPNEVVTWTIKRDLKQEKGGIIYDSRSEL